LVNIPTTSPVHAPGPAIARLRAAQRRGTAQPLIEFPNTPWDSDLRAVNETYVHLGLLAELTANVRERIYDCYDNGTLRLGLSADTSALRLHAWRIDLRVDDQRRVDERARWRSPP
jgi:hypothetical protein